MTNFTFVGWLRHIRRRIESYSGRLPLPSLSPVAPPFAGFAAETNEEFRAIYRGRTAEIFFANEGPIIHKWLHYFAVYDQILAPHVNSKSKMLEIGVSKGGSLALWRKFLGQEAVIFGIDVDPSCASFDGEFARVRIGSQDDPQFLRGVVAEMGGVDVVLDDGSHIATHQRASFDVLFPLLAEGGLYMIEDVHTAYWPGFEGGLRKRGTAIEFLKEKVDEIHKHYIKDGLNNTESMSDIESIQFFDSIAVVRKRKQLPRFHVKSSSEINA
jgi:hypothetical protein